MSDQLKRNFMQQLLDKMNPNPVPVSHSNGVCMNADENTSSKPNWNGSILYSLFLLVGESKELSPELFEGLPAIDLIALKAYTKEFMSCPEDLSSDEHASLLTEKFGSLLKNIKEANAAAARAFAYVKAELANKGVDIKFEKDLSHFAHDKKVPTPAYFVLHHGDSYGITAATTSILKNYITWLADNIPPW